MAAVLDFYAVLGVPRTATAEEIKRAYRKLARQFHPDVNKAKNAEEKFKEVGAAFEVLGDDARRKLYDEFGPEGLRAGFNVEAARAFKRGGYGRQSGVPQQGPVPGEDFDFSDLLNDLFRRGQAEKHAAGADIVSHLQVSLHDAYEGAQRELSVEKPSACARCGGSGMAPGGRPHTCQTCKGSGRVRMAGPLPMNMPCSACGGSGVEPGPPCPTCVGSGEVAAVQRLSVKIPKGVEDGSRIRLAGLGGPGVAGGPAGDLYLEVSLKPHPLLHREGLNLTIPVPVTVLEAIEGAEVDVPTLGGHVRVKVPPGTQSGKRMRLKGRGMPSLKGAVGDLYVVIEVHVPKADAEAVKAAKELEGKYAAPVRGELKL